MADSQSEARVVIVGGGITGLAAAWYLQQAGIPYTLLEASDRWGGKIGSEQVTLEGETEPFIIESAADSFLTQKPYALDLARELGLEPRLLGTNDHIRRTYILKHGQLIPLPRGLSLITPTKFVSFLLSPLLSWRGKFRALYEAFIPAKSGDDDESLARFIRRRFGPEMLDKIGAPLLAGIYSGDVERLSIMATFPRLRQTEKQHGSLIRAARKTPSTPSANPTSMFVSFRGGTAELTDALAAKLTGNLHLNCAVKKLSLAAEGLTPRLEGSQYSLTLSDGTTLDASAVILTTPAFTTAKLVRDLAPKAAADLNAIPYNSTGSISLAFRRDDVPHPLDGFGLLIPASEGRPINAMTWASTKFDHRAPENHALIRVFFGGVRHPEMMSLKDDALAVIVRSELKALLGISAAPLFQRIYRWPNANPQYEVGHLERVSAIESALPDGLTIAGSAYRGIGIPDCIYQARQVAQQIASSFVQKTTAS
jgi:protoporphyrinogen/coproporphyrinogen III oxidase